MKRNHNTAITIFLCAGLVLVALCFGTSDVFARAGGGGGYSGGGGGGGGGFGGGGSGGGGGGGDLIGLLIWLCFTHPLIGIPLLIGFGALMYYGGNQGRNAHRGRVIRRGNAVFDTIRSQEAVEKIRAADPDFDAQAFYSRVRAAFVKIQAAWSAQDMEPVRAFVSDGIYERFSLQIQEQRDLGYRNVMENVQVGEIQFAQVESDDLFDLASLRIDASAVDYRVPLAGGREIAGSRRTDNFAEYWTFLRRRSATTGDRPGLIEGNCPNCGAEIALNQTTKCTSCDSLLRSGQYDWVLCEITQECEWDGRPHEKIPGVTDFRQSRDPGFHLQHVEDRASVVFWRKAMADRLGATGPLAKMATPAFCEGYDKLLAGDESGRSYRGDCAVGAVDTIGVLPGDDIDRALVEIRWSGSVFLVAPNGSRKQTSQGAAYRHLFIFARRAGVKTNLDQAVSSSHCPGCGAPESSLASHACEFCGEVLNTGFHDWVLTEISPIFDNKAQELMRQVRQQPTAADTAAAAAAVPLGAVAANGAPSNGAAAVPLGSELLAWTVKMALADSELDEKEQKMLNRVAAHHRVDPQRMEMLVDAARRGQLDVPEPHDRDQARLWLTRMADVSLWDGRIHREEFKLLCQAGQKFDYSEYDIKSLLRRRKTKLYEEARQRLKSSP